MKLTRIYLKQMIKEELKRVLKEEDPDLPEDPGTESSGQQGTLNGRSIKVGDFIEVTVSDDKTERSIRQTTEKEYDNTKSVYSSFKALAKIIQIAKTKDYY